MELAATSRRHHVATSPHHDVGSTMQKSTIQQRLNVATSPRRDVSSKICTSSFNVRTARKLGDREAYEERHGFLEEIDTDFEEVPGICTVLFWILR